MTIKIRFESGKEIPCKNFEQARKEARIFNAKGNKCKIVMSHKDTRFKR